MLILSRVCAEFHDRTGRTLFSIRPSMLLTFLEAPDEIWSDPLFDLLVRDGSLEAVESVSRKRELENNPSDGAAPDGSKKAPPADVAPESGEQESSADQTPPSEKKPASRKKSTSAPEEKLPADKDVPAGENPDPSKD